MQLASTPIIVALDHDTDQHALAFAQQLKPQQCRLKIGSALFTRYGPRLVEQLMQRGFEIFLDLKFHDIPQTVALACRQAAALGVWMINVHALGGERMLHAARDALAACQTPPLLIAVTLLTSLQQSDLTVMGITGEVSERVLIMAQQAKRCGLDGVVCSAQEASRLRAELGDGLVLVTPGIRLSPTANDDQQRIMTPGQALAAGSDYLVMGRPITQADQPQHVLTSILEQLN